MIDPLTLSAAVSGATAAYNGIKKAIMMGREIEDLSSQLSTWMKAVSDVDNIHKTANNPSTFDKLFNGSVEEVAMESFASKKKLQKQREELKNFLVAHYGLKAWDDLLREEGRIRKARQEEKKEGGKPKICIIFGSNMKSEINKNRCKKFYVARRYFKTIC